MAKAVVASRRGAGERRKRAAPTDADAGVAEADLRDQLRAAQEECGDLHLENRALQARGGGAC